VSGPSHDGIGLSWPGKDTPEELEAALLRHSEDWGPLDKSGFLIQGESRSVLLALEEAWREGIDLVYIDPPFATGKEFLYHVRVGEERRSLPAYRDAWEGGLSGYLSMMHGFLRIVRRLLAPEGSLFLHCDHRAAWALEAVLREVFGSGSVVSRIVWHYTGGGRSKRCFSSKHDTIFWVAKGRSWTFNIDEVRVPYKKGSGYAASGIVSKAGKRYLPDPRGTPVDDVWDIPIINPMSGERLGYPTQKPEALLERIIRAASLPGDTVADFFCGSGTSIAVAERLGRRWIGCDEGPWSVQTCRRRLVEGGASFSLHSAEALQGPCGELSAELVDGRVRLAGFRPSAELASQLGKPPERWTGWIDAWAVDPSYDGEVFRPSWSQFRSAGKTLDLEAPAAGPGPLAIWVATPLGETCVFLPGCG
jgi:site-specific DNA-methyltransferase (adenine-specific)